MSENKRHKRHDIEHTDDTIDHISNLPDCILHLILSFLPIFNIVRTSRLSKRWKNLWASVPIFDVDEMFCSFINQEFQQPPEKIPEALASFENFEQRFLLRSHDAPKIQIINLECHWEYDPIQISSWISNAVMQSVRELHLCVYDNDPTAFSQSIFDSKSLVILDLLMIRFVIPSRIYLPCLKTLRLTWVIFPDKKSTEKLFSNCPLLEELVLSGCDYGSLMNITISGLTLKKLTIIDRGKFFPDFNPIPIGCKIKIVAKNLTYFDYDGYLENEILLNNIPSLVKACIQIPLDKERQNEVAYGAIDLLKKLRNVVFFSISNCTLESLICAVDKMNPFPVFPNLTHLDLTTEIGNHTFGTFMYLLNFCPTLQSISLSKGFNNSMGLGEDDSIWLSAPRCISYNLKTMSFKNLHANNSEILFLKYVLKYACVLEKMDVWWCKPEPPDIKKQRDVRRKLEMTEKSSATCIINFS